MKFLLCPIGYAIANVQVRLASYAQGLEPLVAFAFKNASEDVIPSPVDSCDRVVISNPPNHYQNAKHMNLFRMDFSSVVQPGAGTTMSWTRYDTQPLDRAAQTAAVVYQALSGTDPGFAQDVPAQGRLILTSLRASVPVPLHGAKYDDVQASISHEYTCQEPFYFSFQHITLNPLYRYTKTSYSSRSGISSHRLLYV